MDNNKERLEGGGRLGEEGRNKGGDCIYNARQASGWERIRGVGPLTTGMGLVHGSGGSLLEALWLPLLAATSAHQPLLLAMDVCRCAYLNLCRLEARACIVACIPPLCCPAPGRRFDGWLRIRVGQDDEGVC